MVRKTNKAIVRAAPAASTTLTAAQQEFARVLGEAFAVTWTTQSASAKGPALQPQTPQAIRKKKSRPRKKS